ncbi:hypothetical protein SEA_SONALI_19 [Arthrobacter phage Sonali]|uniref:Uncharacterized protein n=1 Tax=Arthrobacter phage Sonali TaxID=2510495 RepID=A0A411CQD1_9CAUD|nr:hypothetical protein HOV09_gp19 [Arthrobacter phage Sonali]QAY16131.1 hypothetical protein SEA_SONALI_19 [Arthrobacter phage Sonali]
MVNPILDPSYDLARRIQDIENQLRSLATSPILLNASTGQDGAAGLTTDTNGLHAYNASGVEVISIDTATGGVRAAGAVGSLSMLSGAEYGYTVPVLYWSTTDGGGVQSAGSVLYQSYNELVLNGPRTSTNSSSQAVLSLKDINGQLRAFNTSGAGACYLSLNNSGTFWLGNWAATAGVYTSAQNGPVLVIGGLTVSGTKNFVMDHPTIPGWSLKHASTESPHNGVEYWDTVTLDESGEVRVELPGYFEALTYAEGRNIQLTPIGRATVPVSADRITDGAFTIYGAPGQEVDWLVKAVRRSTNPDEPIDFDVEGPKENTPPPPPPPDDYIPMTEQAGPVWGPPVDG